MKRTQQLQVLLILAVVYAVFHNVLYSRVVNSILEQGFVVVEQLRDGLLGVHSVVLVGLHALSEEMGDPLGDVELVLLVVLGTQL